MDSKEKLALLNSVKLLASIPDEQLLKLGEYLREERFEDGKPVFEEGMKGDRLYFITKGQVRIAKKLRTENVKEQELKELAMLGPGDCFGEMALIDAVPRSADAVPKGDAVLFSLSRDTLNEWLKGNPAAAMSFFTRLVQTLSGRLRTSSGELTLLFDLSHLLLETFESPKQLLDRVMTRIMQYLEGDWCAGAYVYNEFNGETELIDVEGDYEKIKDRLNISANPSASEWTGESTYQVVFPGQKRIMGYIVFHRACAPNAEEKNEFTRTMDTTAGLITSALVNIGYRTEDNMRARLKKNVNLGGF